MVILEALVLGLPIVTVAFASAESALPEGSGLVVPQTDEALAAGMHAFLDGTVVALPFDPDDYNREAVDQFYRAIGVPRETDLPEPAEPKTTEALELAEPSLDVRSGAEA